MKRHVQVPGIRQWAAEDFLELQSEPMKVLDGFFEEYGPCIIRGCRATKNADETYNLTAGLVALEGTDAEGNRCFKVVPFSGMVGTPMPIYLTLANSPVKRQYVDGAIKPIAYEYYAAASVAKPENVPFLELKTDRQGAFVDVLQDSKHVFLTAEEREKLNNLAGYIHPKTHPASMIVFDDGETLQYKYDLSQQVTYEYTLEVSPGSLSFGAVEEVKGLSITSYRTKFIGGVPTEETEQVDYTAVVISGTDAFSIQDVAVTAGQNNTENSRSGAILVTQEGSGKTVTVSLSQAAGEVSWEYRFSVTPAALNFANAAGSQNVTVVSDKQKKINGINSGNPVSVSFSSVVTSGSDAFSVDGNTVAVTTNGTETQRNGTVRFTQVESDKIADVSLSQAAGEVTWEYTLSVNPESLSFETSGGTRDVSVTSYKRKYINGSYTGEQINVGCSSSVTGAGFSTSGTSITAGQNNTLSDRSGTVTFTQSESGKQASVSLNQSKGVEGWNYTFEASPSSLSFDAAGGTKQVSVTSYKRQTVNGIENGVQENVGYSSSTSGSGFSSSDTSISAEQNNTLFTRNGSITFTQSESGKQVSVALSQKQRYFGTVRAYYQTNSDDGAGLSDLIELNGTNGEFNFDTLYNPSMLYIFVEIESVADILNLQVPDGSSSADVVNWGINYKKTSIYGGNFEYGYDIYSDERWVKDYWDTGNYFDTETTSVPSQVSKPYKIGFYFEYPYEGSVMEKAILKAKAGEQYVDVAEFKISGIISR